ncbi:MAG: hypothetical protein GDA67_11445 [Nitrospira sp. CR1.3]|nr:hypothetical protein [Nitrospira sp. CR1.3]
MTIEIDRRLLRQAQKGLGMDTIKDTVEASLRTVIRQDQLQKLADALGTIPLDLTSEQLRQQRRNGPRMYPVDTSGWIHALRTATHPTSMHDSSR